MIYEISNYLLENREKLELPQGQGSTLNFFKIGGNPWKHGRINFLIFYKGHSEPVLFVKVMRERDKNESLRHEYNIIKRVASCEKLALFLPLPVHIVNLSGRDVMIQKACHGERMLSFLSTSPILYFQKDTIVKNFSRALEFITLLNTYQKNHINIDEFRNCIIEPIKHFYKEYYYSKEDNSALVKLLDRISHLMENNPLTTILHGDFSATNIFLGSNNQMKIIDWETATANGLPFFDLFYFMSKYIHNLKVLPKNRWRRVESSYFGKNCLSEVIKHTVDEYCRQTSFSIELARLIFPLHFLNKAQIKYAMRGRDLAQPWMELFESSIRNLDKLCF